MIKMKTDDIITWTILMIAFLLWYFFVAIIFIYLTIMCMLPDTLDIWRATYVIELLVIGMIYIGNDPTLNLLIWNKDKQIEVEDDEYI